ncbi:MAG: hypothetical protein WCE80_14085 [Acidimicrobiia bacterium]
MKCPFCEYEGPRPEMHAHLTDSHGEKVKTWASEGSGRRYFELECPDCDDSFRHQVKPRSRDPNFLEEYAREIRIVAFDQFLYHRQLAHEKE